MDDEESFEGGRRYDERPIAGDDGLPLEQCGLADREKHPSARQQLEEALDVAARNWSIKQVASCARSETTFKDSIRRMAVERASAQQIAAACLAGSSGNTPQARRHDPVYGYWSKEMQLTDY